MTSILPPQTARRDRRTNAFPVRLMLRDIPYDTRNEIGWWVWVRDARAVPGETLMFHNRIETGLNI